MQQSLYITAYVRLNINFIPRNYTGDLVFINALQRKLKFIIDFASGRKIKSLGIYIDLLLIFKQRRK